MDTENKFHGIDDYAVQTIRNKARQLVGTAGFTELDREDIEQELILSLIKHLPRFDPTSTKRDTFIVRVVNNRAVELIRAQTAQIRDYRLRCSLDTPVGSEEDDITRHIDTVDLDDYLYRTGKASRRSTELRDLAMDIQLMIESLPPELRGLCEMLKTNNVSEIHRSRRIARSTMYKRIKRLREIFEEAGLKDYFRF